MSDATPAMDGVTFRSPGLVSVHDYRVGDRVMYRGQLCEVIAQKQDGTFVIVPVLEAARMQAAQRRPRNRKERRAVASQRRRA